MRRSQRSLLRIAPEKLKEYLLAPDHPRGASKAAFFRRLGFMRLAWRRLEADLRALHDSHSMQLEVLTPYGLKYRIGGRLTGPNGRTAIVITIWIVREGESIPRFVTAFPGKAP